MIVKKIASSQGFTVLELVLVIVIIGVILAVTVTPNWTGTSLRIEFEARRVLNDIRYAQAMSMASGQRYRWVRTSATSYQITDEAGSPIMLANGGTTLTLSGDVSLGSFTNLPNNLVAFDSRGTPYTDSSYPGTALGANAVIPVTNGSETHNVLVAPTTGYGAVQ